MTLPLSRALHFTSHVSRCRKCRRLFRVSQEAIDLHRERTNPTDGLTDRQIAGSIDHCLTDHNPMWESQEIVPEGPWMIPNLTPEDIFALDAALEVAGDDTEEPYPGLWIAHEKVKRVVDEVRAVGHEAPSPETSRQSQSYIDDASPFARVFAK